MNKLAKLMGNPSIALIAIVISCVAILAGFFWQHQYVTTQHEQAEAQQHQHIAKIIHDSVEQQVQTYQQQLTSLSTSPLLVSAIYNPTAWAEQQRQLKHSFPTLQKACLLSANIDAPDPNACIPISFATLESIRTAKTQGQAPISVIQPQQGAAYLLLVQKIQTADNATPYVLLLTLSPSTMKTLLLPSFGQDGYVELQQGKNNSRSLVAYGDKEWRQGVAPYSLAVKHSHWTVSYWPMKKASSINYLVVASIVLVTVLLMWLLRERAQGYVLRHDLNVLKNQLIDLSNSQMKAKYPTVIPEMDAIVDEIKRLGQTLPMPSATRKKQAVVTPTVSVEELPDDTVEEIPALEEEVKPAEPKSSEPLEFTLPETEVKKAEPIALNPADITPKIFKAYDIRGVVDDTLDSSVVRAIAQAIGSEAIDRDQHRIVVGRDGRLSSEMLSKALVEGLMASGCDVVDIGEVPTPLVSFACEHLQTGSGVMVTASHNPAQYNGLKITLAGKPVFGAALQQLYQRILQGNIKTGQGHYQNVDIVDDYIAKVVSDVHLIRPFKVVVDCGNGVGGKVVPKVLSALGCEVVELYCDVDGNFPNHHPNPSEPANLQDLILAVKRSGAELGLAFDGDGDRLGTVDTEGNIIWSDRLMIMFAQDILSRVPGGLVIYDVKSTSLLGDAISGAGGEALMWQSGYAKLRDKLQETGAVLAGEMSGHIFFNDRWYGFDDAIYTSCRLAELLARDPLERSSRDIFAAIPNRESTPEILVEMEELECQKFVQQFVAEASFSGAKISTIDGLRADFSEGWGLVRASNTVPGLTLRFEADTEEALLDIQQQFKQQMLQVKPTITLLF